MSNAHEESRMENMYEQEQEDLAYQVETLIKLYKTHAPDGHWFEENTMRFFDSRIEFVGEYGYFVSSECGPDNVRKYTVRQVYENSRMGIRNVSMLGEFISFRAAMTNLKLNV